MKKIEFKGIDEGMVEVSINGETRTCMAYEVPFPAFEVRAQITPRATLGFMVHPFWNEDNRTWSFSVGLRQQNDALPAWAEPLSGVSFTNASTIVEFECPAQTEVIWYKDEA